MAVCMGANPQGLEYGLHYRRAVTSFAVKDYTLTLCVLNIGSIILMTVHLNCTISGDSLFS